MASKPPPEMHPFILEALHAGQQVFARALMSAVASTLDDVSRTAREVDRRTRKAKSKIQQKWDVNLDEDEEE